MGLGVERGRVGIAQRDDAPAEAAACHAGTQDAGLTEQVLDQLVHRRHRNAVVAGQAAVPFGHDGAQPGEVAPGQEPLGLPYPRTLGDDMTGAPAQDRIVAVR